MRENVNPARTRRRRGAVIVTPFSLVVGLYACAAQPSSGDAGARDDVTRVADEAPPNDAAEGGDAPTVGDAGADAQADAQPTGLWDCPTGWVRGAHGGCGPAVVLCHSMYGGAAAEACRSVDVTVPVRVPGAPGETVEAFSRTGAGALRGPWAVAEAGSAQAPPAADWTPFAATRACPAGWTVAADRACAPSVTAACPVGAHALADGSCTHTALDDCASTPFADVSSEATGARVIYVDPAAPGGGSGARDAPLASLDAALAAAPEGSWVLLSAGAHAVTAPIGRGVHVVGLCAARTVLQPAGTLTVTTGADLRAVRLLGSVRASGTGTLRLERVRLSGRLLAARSPGRVVTGVDLFLDGATASAEEGAALTLDRSFIAGVFAQGAATSVTLRRSLVESLLDASTGARLVVEDTAVVSAPVRANAGAAFEATRSSFEGAPSVALLIDGGGTTAAVTASAIRRTRTGVTDSVEGQAVVALGGSRCTLRDTLVARGQGVALLARDAATVLRVESSVVEDYAAVAASSVPAGTTVAPYGGALRAEDSARIEVSQTAVRRVQGTGVSTRSGAVVLLSSSVFASLNEKPGDELGGSGIEALSRSRVEATAVRVSGAHGAGVLAFDADTTVSLTRSVVEGTLSRTVDRRFGVGAVVTNGAALVLTDSIIGQSRQAGVFASEEGTRVEATGSVVRGTLARESDGTLGAGVELTRGARATITRSAVVDSTEFAVLGFSQGTVVELTDVQIEGVRASAAGFGLGLALYGGARATAARLGVLSTRAAGVAAVPLVGAAGGASGASSVAASGLFVTRVEPGTLQFTRTGSAAGMPSGRPVAYALHAGAGSLVDVGEALLADAEYGIFHSAARLTLRRGVITGHRVAGAANGFDAEHPLSLQDVLITGNDSDEILTNVELPEAQLERSSRQNLSRPAD